MNGRVMKGMMRLRGVTVALLLAVVSVLGCEYSLIEVPKQRASEQDPEVCFDRDIFPIFATSCAGSGCHDRTHPEGVNFSRYEGIFAHALPDSGETESHILELLRETDTTKRMPKGMPALPEATIALIERWIEQGARKTSCDTLPSGCDTMNVSFSGVIKPLIMSQCIGCHATGSAATNRNLGFFFNGETSYDSVSVNAERIVGAISHRPGFVSMPHTPPEFPAVKLPDCSIMQFRAWVSQGKLNN
jgi:hypothetical protein